jgi:hypothetical protein
MEPPWDLIGKWRGNYILQAVYINQKSASACQGRFLDKKGSDRFISGSLIYAFNPDRDRIKLNFTSELLFFR